MVNGLLELLTIIGQYVILIYVSAKYGINVGLLTLGALILNATMAALRDKKQGE